MADEFFNGNDNNSDNQDKNPYEQQNSNDTNQNNGFGGSDYQNQNGTNNNYQKQNNTDYYGRHECNNPYERHENSNRYDQNERDNPYVSGSSGSGANGFAGYNGNNSNNFGGGTFTSGSTNNGSAGGSSCGQNPYANNNSGNELYADNKKPGRGFGIASMVLGILSLVCCCTAYFGIVLGVLGLIFGIISYKKGSNGFAIAGIITSSFGILTGIIMVFIVIFAEGINWDKIFPFDSSWNFPESDDSSFDPNTDAFVEIGKTIKNFLGFKR